MPDGASTAVSGRPASAVLELAQALLRCPSVTPGDGGAQALLIDALRRLGFQVWDLPFGTTPNFFARIGDAAPHFCFAGHTDVVPPGDGWRYGPFDGAVVDGVLHGRGACDMKGAIAAFVDAAAAHLRAGAVRGSISLLITGDEEGPAQDGTRRVLGWMAAQGHLPEACLVGEPTNPSALGEIVKIGRRGSLNASVRVRGTQGHVAYTDRADNPVHRLIGFLAAATGTRLDAGSAWFEPSSLQVTSIDVGNQATNIIPASASARLNIRFSDRHSGAALTAWLAGLLAHHAPGAELETAVTGEAFLTQPGAFTSRLCGAIARITGTVPRLDTGGGTSDARFIARFVPVAEFGLVGASMHKTDEHVPVLDLERLSAIYAAILAEFLP